MKTIFSYHEAGCDSLTPCRSCIASVFLKRKLTPKDFETLALLTQDKRVNAVGLDEPIERLGLSKRGYNCLFYNGIRTIREVVSKTDRELKKLPNFGQLSLAELDNALAKRGRWRGEPLPK